MNEAIKLAIEKGWQQPPPCELDGIEFYHKGEAVLDPLFWQAIGKALGWEEFAGRGKGPYPIWKWQAHQYFDLFLTGGDTEKFWQELLNN